MENKEILNKSEIVVDNVEIELICSESNLKDYLEIQINYENSEHEYKISEKTLIPKYNLYDYLKFVNNFDLNNNEFEKICSYVQKCLLIEKYCSISVLENICNTLNFTLSSSEIQCYYESNPFNIENDCSFHVDKVLLMNIDYKIQNNLNKFENVQNDYDFIKQIVHLIIKEWIFVLKECENINNEYFERENY